MPSVIGSAPAIAIVGMSCIFPGAPSVDAFWKNILGGVDATREPGAQEWNAEFFKAKPRSEFGNVYCTRGGFISEYAEFDPLEFGIMPRSIRGGDPDQFLVLRVASEAMADAGYHHKTFNGDKAEVIIGRTMAPGVGSLNLIQHGQTVDQVLEILAAVSPELNEEELSTIGDSLKQRLAPCNADTIPAVMPNVMAGRIASKLGFRGRNLILDAACASSLIAVEIATQGLLDGRSDLAIAGGVHVSSSAGFSQMFCGVGALSRSGVIRPFDDGADGTLLGEGVGMVVLKRLADAEADGNKIYAVIRGVGSSSDGRSGGLLSPSVEGEALAMRRAYEMAGISPRTVELLEAHGTATTAGDRAEMKAIQTVFCPDGEEATKPWCAIGSVKSMIGHTQAASGMAGLIKTAMALRHKVLPPTINVVTPNSNVNWADGPCYLITEPHPWESREETTHPRRAAVSAFGFGGVNAHLVVEEYPAATNIPTPDAVSSSRPSAKKMHLSLKFPYFAPSELSSLPLRQPPETAPADEFTREPAHHRDFVMSSFVDSITSAHKDVLDSQESVMLEFLAES